MQIPHDIDFSKFIKLVGEGEAQEIRSAGFWKNDLIERSYGETITGDCLPWAKTFPLFRLRPGELTLWDERTSEVHAGGPGHVESLGGSQGRHSLA